MTPSLQTRLTLAIIGVAGLVAAVIAALLYTAVSAVLWDDFEHDVTETAQIFAKLVEWEGGAEGFELEGGEAIARQLVEGPSPRHALVRSPHGMLLSDADLVGHEHDLPLGTVGTIVTDDGRELHGMRLIVEARSEYGDPPPGLVEVVVACDPSRTRATLATIAAWCWLLAAGTTVLAAVVARVVARRGMAPVRRVARALDGIGEPDDPFAVALDDVPAELRVIVRETNALLARLRASFARERRFTADVAHELRTPLSVVRTAIDVALQGEREPDEYRRRLRGVQEHVVRLTTMVDSLLLLSRAAAGQIALRRAPLPIFAVVEDCWVPFAAKARSRRLTFRNELALETSFEADEASLRMILTNLLGNACEYTPHGGSIRVTTGDAPNVLLAIYNTGPSIPAEHLEHLFEPFWRADSARSDAGVHCGLGLAISRALARCQDLDVHLRNIPGGVVATVVVPSVLAPLAAPE